MRTRVIGMLTVALVAVAGIALAQPARAADDEFSAGGVEYRINADGSSVSAVGLADDFTGTVLTIPDTVTHGDAAGDATTYPVTAIPDPPDPNGWDGSFASAGLTRVTIGDNLTSIGNSAFALNGSLTSVTLGSSVRSIGLAAFARVALSSIDLPDSLRVIGTNAFMYDAAISHITLPKNLTTLGAWAFDRVGDLDVTFAGAAPATMPTGTRAPFEDDATVHFTCRYADPATTTGTDQTRFTLDADGKWHGYTTVPTSPMLTYAANGVAGVTGTQHAVGCGSTIGDDADAPTLPNGAAWYTDDAATTPFDAATKIYTDTTLYAGAPTPVTATSGDLVYRYDLTDVDAGATVLGWRAGISPFHVQIPDSVTFDGVPFAVTAVADSAFRGDDLTTVSVGDSVATIGSSAFAQNFLTHVAFGDSVATIGDDAFVGNLLTSVTIPDTVTTIGEEAFMGNRLTSVTISPHITTISHNTFAFNSLRSVTIPGSVTTIDKNAFGSNPALSDVTFEGAAPTTITARDDNQPSLPTDATVHFTCSYADPAASTAPFIVGTWQGYTSVGSDVTLTYDPHGIPTVAQATDTIGCGSTITDDADAPALPRGAAWYTDEDATTPFAATTKIYSDTTLYAGAPDPVEASADGILYRYDLKDVDAGATAIGFGTGFTGTTLDIPDTVTFDGIVYRVTAIGDHAFYNTSLTGVVIGDNVTTIGDHAFSEDFGLVEVTLGDGVTSIGAHAFSYDWVNSITIPDGVTTIGQSAFLGNALESLSVPDSVTSIGPAAFGSNRISHLTIGDGVTVIDNAVFADNQLTSVTIPDGVTRFGDYAFYGNPDLRSVTFQGAAPATITAAGRDEASLPPDATVHFTCSYADPSLASPFTVGAWQGYASVGSTISYTFDMNGAPGTGATAVNVPCGDTAATAYAPATPDGAHWYTDAAASTRADMTAARYSDATLYVGMAPQFSYAQAEGVAGDALSAAPTITAAPAATFTLGDGSTLPKGLHLDHATGTVSGTPHAPFDDTVTIIATNAVGQTATPLTLTIAPAPGILFHLTVAGAPFTPGSTVTVTGSGVPDGTAVQIDVHSDPVALGTVTADANGAFALTTALPADLETGAHTITASITVDGTTSTQSVPITIAAAATGGDDTGTSDTGDTADAGDAADTGSAGSAADTAGTASTTGTNTTATSTDAVDLAATGGDSGRTAVWAWFGLVALLAGLGLVAARRRHVHH